MSKQKKEVQPGDHIALHELHLGDTDGLGPTVIRVGEPVPDGAFDATELARLIAKKAIQAPPGSAKAVKAAGASREDLDDITGTAGDDGLGDGVDATGEVGAGGESLNEGGEGGDAGDAATSIPAAKSSGKSGTTTRVAKNAARRTR